MRIFFSVYLSTPTYRIRIEEISTEVNELVTNRDHPSSIETWMAKGNAQDNTPIVTQISADFTKKLITLNSGIYLLQVGKVKNKCPTNNKTIFRTNGTIGDPPILKVYMILVEPKDI